MIANSEIQLTVFKELLGSQLGFPTLTYCQTVWYNLTVELQLEIVADLS